jgi:hypothetical protein
MRKRNTIRLTNIAGGAYTNVELVSDRLGPYIQLLRRSGVNTYTRLCSDVLWSGIIGDDEYFEAPCVLDAFIAISGTIFICASLYDGYGTENNPQGLLLRCLDAPLSYYESQLIVTKPDDVGMSILINVK